jgi:hypothetical protein
MDMQEVEIRVDREGNVAIHVQGVRGEECTWITKSIEEALGDLTDRTLSGEFYEEQGSERSHNKAGRS